MTFIPSVLTDVDSKNSSTTNLGSGAEYEGKSNLTTGYATLDLTITSDQNSAASGIQIQFSDDGTTFTTFYTDTFFAGTTYFQSFKLLKKYYRVKYLNGSSPTNSFNLVSRLNVNNESGSSNTNINNYGNTNTGDLDAFGKLRVSNPLTLLDLNFMGVTGITETDAIKTNFLQMSSTGTNGYANVTGDGFITLTGTGSGLLINQSRKYCIYQPGKSLLFLASGVIYESGPNNGDYTTRLGYFDDKNGVFFQYNNGVVSVNVRNQNVDTSIPQDSWNIDRMDGTGPSGVRLNFNKTQLYVIDFEWLGVGRIRYGFYIFGQIYYCHQVTNLNILTGPYMSSADLPIRYEVRGTNAGQTTPVVMKQVCSSVISEGGYNPVGLPFAVGATGPIDPVNSTAEYVILALKGNSSYYHENVVPSNFQILDSASGTNVIIYRLRLYLAPESPSVSSPLTYYNVNNNSVIEAAVPDTPITVTPGNSLILQQGFIQGKGTIATSDLSNIFSNFSQITSDINNVSDTLVLTAKTYAGNSKIFGSIEWSEAS